MYQEQSKKLKIVCAGSLPFVAPEVLQNGELAKSADMYSFAVMLLEMWTGRGAYADENYHSVSTTNCCSSAVCLYLCLDIHRG